ncbi:hypothetical protein STEG23_008839 [Scotinomys teguina]
MCLLLAALNTSRKMMGIEDTLYGVYLLGKMAIWMNDLLSVCVFNPQPLTLTQHGQHRCLYSNKSKRKNLDLDRHFWNHMTECTVSSQVSELSSLWFLVTQAMLDDLSTSESGVLKSPTIIITFCGIGFVNGYCLNLTLPWNVLFSPSLVVESFVSPSLLLYLPPRVLWLTGNFYILSSWQAGVFSSYCLALDSSSSFPCPAFRVIAKSVILYPSVVFDEFKTR